MLIKGPLEDKIKLFWTNLHKTLKRNFNSYYAWEEIEELVMSPPTNPVSHQNFWTKWQCYRLFQKFDNSITYLRFNGSFFLEMKKEAHATKAFANLMEFLGRPPRVC